MKRRTTFFVVFITLANVATMAQAGSTGNGSDPTAFAAAEAAKEYNGDLNAAKNCEAKGLKTVYCKSLKAKHQDWYDANGTLKTDLKLH